MKRRRAINPHGPAWIPSGCVFQKSPGHSFQFYVHWLLSSWPISLDSSLIYMMINSLHSKSTIFIRNEHVFVLVTDYVVQSAFNLIFPIKPCYFEFMVFVERFIQNHYTVPGMIVSTCNPSIWEAEVERSPICDQHSKTMFQTPVPTPNIYCN